MRFLTYHYNNPKNYQIFGNQRELAEFFQCTTRTIRNYLRTGYKHPYILKKFLNTQPISFKDNQQPLLVIEGTSEPESLESPKGGQQQLKYVNDPEPEEPEEPEELAETDNDKKEVEQYIKNFSEQERKILKNYRENYQKEEFMDFFNLCVLRQKSPQMFSSSLASHNYSAHILRNNMYN